MLGEGKKIMRLLVQSPSVSFLMC